MGTPQENALRGPQLTAGRHGRRRRALRARCRAAEPGSIPQPARALRLRRSAALL